MLEAVSTAAKGERRRPQANLDSFFFRLDLFGAVFSEWQRFFNLGVVMTARRMLLRAFVGGVAGVALRSQAWGQSILYTYDTLGRIKSATYPNGQVTTYTYDAAGNRTRVLSSGSTPPPPPPPPPPPALTASASAAYWNSVGGVGDPPVSVSVSGGVAPYSYSWQRTSGHTSTGANMPTSASTDWYVPLVLGPGTYSSTWVCVVTDAASSSAQTSSVSVTIEVAPSDPGCDPNSPEMCEVA